MSIAKTAGRGVALTSSALVIGKVLIFANILIILNYLSVYEYGFTELVMTIISTIGILLLPGLTSTIVADLGVARVRDDRGAMHTVFHQFLLLNVTLGAIAWAILFFGAAPVAEAAGNPYVAQFLHIASFLFLISPLRTVTQVLASVMLRFFDQSFYGVIEELWKLVLLLVLVVWLQLGIHGLMYAIVFSQLAVVLCFVPRTLSAYRYFASNPSSRSFRFWELLGAHRKWSIGASYVGTIAQNVRIWIIKFLLGTEAVGLFAFAYGILGNLSSLLPLSSVVTPIIPRYVDKKDQLIRIVRASIKLQFALALGIVVGVFSLSHVFVALLFPKYVAALPLVYILSLTLITNSVISIFTPVFTAYREQKSLLLSNVFKLVSGVVFLPITIGLFGIAGAAVELLITVCLNAAERYYRLRRLLPAFALPLKTVFTPDTYEREAMGTVWTAVVSRLPSFLQSKLTRT